jgi:hypothetical protein
MRELNVFDLIPRSGDSEILDYSYSNGFLNLRLEVDDLDCIVGLEIKTNIIFCNLGCLDKANINVCYIDVSLLKENVDVNNGHYVSPGGFVESMKSSRNCYNLAYGLKEKEAKLLFRLMSSSVLLACIISEESDIRCIIMD